MKNPKREFRFGCLSVLRPQSSVFSLREAEFVDALSDVPIVAVYEHEPAALEELATRNEAWAYRHVE